MYIRLQHIFYIMLTRIIRKAKRIFSRSEITYEQDSPTVMLVRNFYTVNSTEVY